MYPDCCATWRYFIGVPYCYIRDILIFLTCDCFGVSNYAWRASMRRIYLLGVEGWSRVPLLKLLRICRLGRRGQVISTILITTFWLVCRRNRSLSPLFQHNIPSLISYFLLGNQPIFFEIMSLHLLTFFKYFSDFFTLTRRTPSTPQNYCGTRYKSTFLWWLQLQNSISTPSIFI